MGKGNTYKTCFVPLCKSTTIKTPNKLFFFVPRDQDIRKEWFKSAHRDDEPGKWSYFCCQDHFDLKEDMDNYIRYYMMGAPVKLKKNVNPHIFDCQPNRIKILNNFSLSYAKPVLNKKREIAEILSDAENQKNNFSNANESPQQPLHKIRRIENQVMKAPDKTIFIDLTNPTQTNTATAASIMEIHSERALLIPELNNSNSINFNDASSISSSTSHIQSTSKPSTSKIEINSDNTIVADSILDMSHSCKLTTNLLCTHSSSNKRSFGVQVYKKLVTPHVRSKFVMCKPSTTNASCQTQIEVTNKICSPIKSLLKAQAVSSNSSTSLILYESSSK